MVALPQEHLVSVIPQGDASMTACRHSSFAQFSNRTTKVYRVLRTPHFGIFEINCICVACCSLAGAGEAAAVSVPA